MPAPIITLTTDFGSHGPYVAAMKGIILGIHPDARLVDVSHEIAPQNMREAAFCLTQITACFAAGTIHLVVVDPGVGTDRRLVCVRTQGQLFLAPDNGVLSWVARGRSDVEWWEISAARFWRQPVSATFHGRDILAPVAAHLSLGVPPSALGPAVADGVTLRWPAPRARADGIDGELIIADRFGNLISNISESDLASRGRECAAMRVRCGGCDAIPLVRTYGDCPEGTVLALVGSSRLLEIAVRNGSAAAKLAAGPGTPVRVTW